MVKRTIEHTQHTACVPPTSKKGFKRRRTDEFLEKTSNFDSTMRTCQFFETHLIQDVHAEKEMELSAPSADAIRKSLTESMLSHELEHRSYCAHTRDDASNAIRLEESFQCLSAGIDDDSSKKFHNHTPPLLSMLNLGPEASHFLKQSISAYAGVPSSSDLQDWQNLDSLLR